MAKLEDPRTA